MTLAETLKSKILKHKDNKMLLLIIISIIPIALFTVYYISSEDMDVLFSGMDKNDMTKVTMALDEKKIPYVIDLKTSSVKVSKKNVRDTRMSLMSDGVILDSNVGFEIFNDSEFGMTEFSQKINYQRALQGELARTISSLKEIKYARVHIVQPKNRLFKSPGDKASASVTLFLQHDKELDFRKIKGIQNIVSSSIENMNPENVVVTNQAGIVLSVNVKEKEIDEAGKISKKEQMEKYYRTKVNDILKSTFGENKYIAKVNVELDYTKLTIIKENYLDLPENHVVKRERLTSTSKTGATTKDIEYQTGKKTENIQPELGKIKRLSIGVLVPKNVSENQIHELKEVISMAIGLEPKRGDSIAVYADEFSAVEPKDTVKVIIPAGQTEEENNKIIKSNKMSEDDIFKYLVTFLGVQRNTLINSLLVFILLLVIFNVTLFVSKKKNEIRLSTKEKEKIMNELSEWFSKE